MSRPRGHFGPVAQALLRQVEAQPGTVREVAERAQVGYGAAAYTISRLVRQGLCVLDGGRPAVVARSSSATFDGDDVHTALDALAQCFWQPSSRQGNGQGSRM